MTRVLLTGASGFAGSHILRHLLSETDWQITCPVTFRHRGNPERIASALRNDDGWHDRVDVVVHDLTAPFPPVGMKIGYCDYVIAMASESHVDRSIEHPVPFIRNNIDVALSVLEYAREHRPEKVIIFSTDEVYGAVEQGGIPHPEWSPILPSNPYAASKACQEAVATSYWRTYGIPVVIVNSMNLIGETQDPEKFLPMVLSKVMRGEVVQIHGVPRDIGSRNFIHARSVADALLFLLRRPEIGMFPAQRRPDRWHVAGDRLTNLELALRIAIAADMPLRYELTDFHSARPGHDPHYSLDASKIAEAGWKAPVPFSEGLERTVAWTLDHREWLA